MTGALVPVPRPAEMEFALIIGSLSRKLAVAAINAMETQPGEYTATFNPAQVL